METIESNYHKKKKIEHTLKNMHPDDPLAFEIRRKYRELQNLK